MNEFVGDQLDETFSLFPSFSTDCGKNIHIGKHVFINSGCAFQDLGGIYIEDGALIGHSDVLATINHQLDAKHRGDLVLRPISIGKNAWIGEHAAILAGVTVGTVVTKDEPAYTVVGGISAKVIKYLKS